MKPPVPPLNLRVATPCRANWGKMAGDERARFCGQCNKHVYNLSALSASAAADLIREKEGKLCARFYQREDGTVLHGEDCSIGLVARQWRQTRKMAVLASLVLMALGLGRAQAEPPAGGGTPAITSGTLTGGGFTKGKICVTAPTPSPSPSPKTNPPAAPATLVQPISPGFLTGDICVVPIPTPKPSPSSKPHHQGSPE